MSLVAFLKKQCIKFRSLLLQYIIFIIINLKKKYKLNRKQRDALKSQMHQNVQCLQIICEENSSSRAKEVVANVDHCYEFDFSEHYNDICKDINSDKYKLSCLFHRDENTPFCLIHVISSMYYLLNFARTYLENDMLLSCLDPFYGCIPCKNALLIIFFTTL